MRLSGVPNKQLSESGFIFSVLLYLFLRLITGTSGAARRFAMLGGRGGRAALSVVRWRRERPGGRTGAGGQLEGLARLEFSVGVAAADAAAVMLLHLG